MLKEIPKGSSFTIRIVEPQKAGFGKERENIYVILFYFFQSKFIIIDI